VRGRRSLDFIIEMLFSPTDLAAFFKSLSIPILDIKNNRSFEFYSKIIETINFADGTSETIDYHLANKTFYGVESITLQENEDEIWSINASGLYITSLSNRETVTLTLDSNAILYDYQK
jgi:hypothetical protein